MNKTTVAVVAGGTAAAILLLYDNFYGLPRIHVTFESAEIAGSPAQARPTYEEWLVQQNLALSPEQVDQLEALTKKYTLGDYKDATYCVTRVSNGVHYQAGFTDSTIFDDVTETLSGKPNNGHMLKQRFPKDEKMGTTLGNRTINKGIETRFFDATLDGIAEQYEVWHYDALGEERVIPTITGGNSRVVSVNKEMRAAYNTEEDPYAGLGSFEIYRQVNYTGALRRFLNDPENNKPCAKWFGNPSQK